MKLLTDISALGFWISKAMRAPLSIYVVVSKNAIKVRNLENGKTASGESQEKFSSDRLLIADFEKAENFAKELIQRVAESKDLKTRKLKLICHPLDDKLADLSPAEKMIFNDFAFQIGGRIIHLINDTRELSDLELKEKFLA